MTEEKVITLHEFKIVMEDVENKFRLLSEAMQIGFTQFGQRLDKLEGDGGAVKEQIHGSPKARPRLKVCCSERWTVRSSTVRNCASRI